MCLFYSVGRPAVCSLSPTLVQLYLASLGTELLELFLTMNVSIAQSVLLGAGEQVVEPGTITQVPPETPQEVPVASSTEFTAIPGQASGAATRASMKAKLISPGGASQKALVARQESKLSATPQKPSTARYGGELLSKAASGVWEMNVGKECRPKKF